MAIEKLDSADYNRVHQTPFIRKGLKKMWELLLALSALGSTALAEGAALIGISNGGGGLLSLFTGTTVQAALTEAMTKAVDAHADAATADGKAVTADGKAVTADGKAVNAQADATKALKTGGFSLSDATPATTLAAAGANAGFLLNTVAVTIVDPALLNTAQKIVNAINLLLAASPVLGTYTMSVLADGRYLIASSTRGRLAACVVTAGLNDIAAALKLGVANDGTEQIGTEDATLALADEVAARKDLEARVVALEEA